MKTGILILTAACLVASTASAPRAQQGRPGGAASQLATGTSALAPTYHPPLPQELSQVWLAPERGGASSTGTISAMASVAKLYSGGEYSKSLATATQPSLQQGPLALYAAYYAGVSQLGLSKPAEALTTFRRIREQKPVGYLVEAAQMGEADAYLALGKPGDAIAIYERLLDQKPSSFEDVLMRLGRAANAAGDREKAADAFARVYYEFALGDLARAAGTELALLEIRAATPGSPRFKLELGRAERLYGAKQYPAARAAYDGIKSLATGDDRELVQLRLAECDYFLKKFRIAADAAKPLTEGRGKRRAEALYFYAVAARDSGDSATFLAVAHRIADDFPADSWAEEALNSLATYYIRKNEDDRADAVFREMYEKFPAGANAPRAAWKAGWRAYRAGQYDDTVRFFERASADFPRSDYRPSWLYWAGRAHEKRGNAVAAKGRFAIVVADYMNSYYGRLAAGRLGGQASAASHAAGLFDTPRAGDVPLTAGLPANAAVVRALLGAEMYLDALNELRYARRTWGDSSSIQATIAWTNQQRSRTESGMTRFQLVRGAINTMRSAYPQFMAAGGEELPRDILTVIYPMAYWDLIRRHAAQNNLDPYLVAALVAQESTFVADIRSHANAYGLMQLLPSTARQYAGRLKMPYSTRLLTDPEANVRMGTAYLSDKIRQFGGMHLALASYNAGESAVRQWMAERQGVEQDEFIDDIPYPETQGYVRKILGTADDYRRLYGNGEARAEGVDKTPVSAVVEPAAPPAVKAPAKAAPRPAPRAKPAPRKAPAKRGKA